MAHNIATSNGKSCCFTAGQPAWHGLGINVNKAQTWKQAHKLAALDWQVYKNQLEFKGKPVDAWGLFRSDSGEFINSVGSQFVPFQNEDCFSWVDALLDAENGAHYVTAGALGNGEIVWALAKLSEVNGIRGTDDISENYLLFADYRKQGKAAVTKLTNTRVVCNNTLNMAMAGSGSLLRIRHNTDFSERLAFCKDAMQEVRLDIKNLDKKMNFLASRKMTTDSMTKIMNHIFPEIKKNTLQQNRAEKILELYESNDNNAIPQIRGSAYNLLNSFTNYVDHVRDVPLQNKDGKGILVQVKEQKRLESAMFGSGDKFKNDVVDVILQNVVENPLMPKHVGSTEKESLSFLDMMDLTIPVGA